MAKYALIIHHGWRKFEIYLSQRANNALKNSLFGEINLLARNAFKLYIIPGHSRSENKIQDIPGLSRIVVTRHHSRKVFEISTYEMAKIDHLIDHENPFADLC